MSTATLTFTEYQDRARSTRADQLHADITTAALGLCGESGEVADIIKKWRAQGHDLDEDKVVEELGDILWYIALACDSLGITIENVAHLNNKKLAARYPNGFEAHRSINRHTFRDFADPLQLAEIDLSVYRTADPIQLAETE